MPHFSMYCVLRREMMTIVMILMITMMMMIMMVMLMIMMMMIMMMITMTPWDGSFTGGSWLT